MGFVAGLGVSDLRFRVKCLWSVCCYLLKNHPKSNEKSPYVDRTRKSIYYYFYLFVFFFGGGGGGVLRK